MQLFHITPRKNLVPILLQGLLPFRGQGFVYRSEQPGLRRINGEVVWLTDDVTFIAGTQLTPEWCSEYQPEILRVEVAPESVVPSYVHPHEFLHHGVIPPERISRRGPLCPDSSGG